MDSGHGLPKAPCRTVGHGALEVDSGRALLERSKD